MQEAEMIDDQKPAPGQPRKPTFWQIVRSVLMGALGVQSHQRREEDFSSHSPLPFIIGGLVFTGLFIATLVLIVSLVVP